MTRNQNKIHFLRQHIPSFECKPDCHDCCGPVTTSSEEMAMLPEKSEQKHAAAMSELSCPHLSHKGCQVYDERPLICRLFGTTPRLACPNGNKPDIMIDEEIEKQIYQFNQDTRQVLV